MTPQPAPAIAPDHIQIPTPPSLLLLDLERLLAADNVNLQSVAAVIAKDAGITAQIFRALTTEDIFERCQQQG